MKKKKIVGLEREPKKGIAWHIDASSVVWTLIDNGKLANQIAKLKEIVVKYLFREENSFPRA